MVLLPAEERLGKYLLSHEVSRCTRVDEYANGCTARKQPIQHEHRYISRCIAAVRQLNTGPHGKQVVGFSCRLILHCKAVCNTEMYQQLIRDGGRGCWCVCAPLRMDRCLRRWHLMDRCLRWHVCRTRAPRTRAPNLHGTLLCFRLDPSAESSR